MKRGPPYLQTIMPANLPVNNLSQRKNVSIDKEVKGQIDIRLNIIQLNVNRCRAAHDLLFKQIEEERIHLVIGQEPNKKLLSNSKSSFCDNLYDSLFSICDSIPVIDIYKMNGCVLVECDSFIVGSVYFSPNQNIELFEDLLTSLEQKIKPLKKEIILGGDLNAKTPLIGSTRLDKRGRILEEFITSMGMIVLNVGKAHTYVGPGGASTIDFTAATTGVAQYVKDWLVDEETENFSDHNTIKFKIIKQGVASQEELTKNCWNMNSTNIEKFKSHSGQIFNNLKALNPSTVTDAVTEACKKYFPIKKHSKYKPPVYWWNESIATKRKLCNRTRRMVTRAKAKLDPNDNILIELLETLKKAKHELKIEINRSKKARWKELCDELKDNVWGKAYRIVMKKLNSSYSNRLPKETIVEQVHQLFPASQVTVWDRISIKLTDISLFTYEELMMAANYIQANLRD